jgi:hypothetical protein
MDVAQYVSEAQLNAIACGQLTAGEIRAIAAELDRKRDAMAAAINDAIREAQADLWFRCLNPDVQWFAE